jgi:hypothetical protein
LHSCFAFFIMCLLSSKPPYYCFYFRFLSIVLYPFCLLST